MPSTFNSTTTPLAANATFQGQGEDISGSSSILVSILSDQVSAINGLLFSWSQDNITFSYNEAFTISPNVAASYSLAPRARYFKVTYTNGIIDQSYFQLSTLYSSSSKYTQTHSLTSDVPTFASVETVRSVLAAQKQGGAAQTNNFTNLQATTGGFLKASIDTVVSPAIIVPEIVQSNNTGPSIGTSFSHSFTLPTTINNSIIALVLQSDGSSGSTYTFSDSQANIYIQSASFITPGVGQIDLWTTNSIGGPCTVTATNFSQSVTGSIQLYEISGLLVGAPILDKVIIGNGTGNALSVGPIITNHDSEFCISAFVASTSPVIHSGAGWSSDFSAAGVCVESEIQTSAGSITGTATTTSSVNYLGLLATFLPALISRPIVQDATGKLIVKSQLEDDNGLPITLGQKTSSDSVPVVFASDQTINVEIGTIDIGTVNQGLPNNIFNAWPMEITDGYHGPAYVTPPSTAAVASDPALVVAISPNNPITTSTVRPSTSIITSVAVSTSNVVLLANNSLRLGATLFNDSSSLVYVKLGSVATTSSYTIKLFPQSYFEIPFGYTNVVSGFWTTAVSGNMFVDELSQ